MPARWRTPRHGRGPRPRWHRRRRRVRRTRPPRRAARGSRCRRVGKTCATPRDRCPAARRDRTARRAARLAAAPRRGESLRSRRQPRRWPHPTRSRGREPVRRRLARGRHTTPAPRSNGACGSRWRGTAFNLRAKRGARSTARISRGLAVLGPRHYRWAEFSHSSPWGPVNTETLQHIALFEKCRNFLPKAREVQASGLHAWYKPISRSEDTVVVIEGKERIMMGSNNYLGLTHHPEVLAAAKAALERYGSGCTGSRFLNGTLDLHEQLEAELAEFFHKEAGLVFSTGYQANLGVISGLVGRGDVVFLDKLDHASIVDGATMSHGETVRFNHGDLAGLERKLQGVPTTTGMMIIVDGVYSMEGDIADVPNLLKVAQKYGAALALDDAHAVGVLGPQGDGTAAHFDLVDEVDLVVGTFSKSLASIGGFVAGSETVIHYLKHHSRPLIFTAALPPSNTAGVLEALHIMQREPERRDQLWANTRLLQDGLRSRGFDIGPLEKTFLFWRKLFDAGVFTNPVVPPAVPPSQCRLRTSLMATHTPQQIDQALETFARLGKELGGI